MNEDYADLRSEEDEYTIVEGTIVRETDKAILLETDPLEEDVWLPKSQIEYEGKIGNKTEVWVPNWLAEEKGFV